MPNPTIPTADIEDMRDYMKRSYQGALEADSKAFSDAAAVAFADYMVARIEAFARAREQKAVSRAVEAAIGLVGKYSIHAPKGQPKGTLARKRLVNELHQLTHPKKEDI